jgi:hypothetical protein
MIRQSTLFILGAGASKPYGIPTGAELNFDLARIGTASHPIADALHTHLGIAHADTVAFSRSFLLSRTPSIDAFLATRDTHSKIGKYAIAAALIACEHPDYVHGLAPPPKWDDWLAIVWAHMREGVDKVEDLRHNNVRFVTFNYDRSLEFFLHHAIKESFGVSDDKARKVGEAFNVLHLYGDLGPLFPAPGVKGRSYERDVSTKSLEIAASAIRVIPEARDDDKCFAMARHHIAWAKKICFLGFGFDSLNVKRLDLKSCVAFGHHKYIVASVLNKRRGERFRLQQELLGSSIREGSGSTRYHDGATIYDWEEHDEVSSETLRRSLLFVDP